MLSHFMPDMQVSRAISHSNEGIHTRCPPAKLYSPLLDFVKLFVYLNDNLPEYYDTLGNRRSWGDGIGGHQTSSDLFIRTPADLGRGWKNLK
jgi:hypothetical protein